jgi:hypothetical protein
VFFSMVFFDKSAVLEFPIPLSLKFALSAGFDSIFQ